MSKPADKPISEAVELFKCLGDQTRFDILCLLSKSDSYVELLAEKLSLTPGTVSFHLKKLEAAGIVGCSRTQFYMIYSLKREVLDRTILSFLEYDEALDDDTAYENKIIDSFIENGRLRSIPAQLKKREVICRHILREFESDRDYSESEVNEIISRYHDDFCTLRREFISLGYMTRDHEVYRKTTK